MRDLRTVHVVPSGNNIGKIIAAAVVVLGIGAAGVYGYRAGMWSGPPKQVVSDSQLPSPGLPDVHAPASR